MESILFSVIRPSYSNLGTAQSH